jgi:hypothetical protein
MGRHCGMMGVGAHRAGGVSGRRIHTVAGSGRSRRRICLCDSGRGCQHRNGANRLEQSCFCHSLCPSESGRKRARSALQTRFRSGSPGTRLPSLNGALRHMVVEVAELCNRMAHSVPASRAPAINPPGGRGRQLCFSGCDNVEMDTVEPSSNKHPPRARWTVSICFDFFPSQNIFARPNQGAFSWI